MTLPNGFLCPTILALLATTGRAGGTNYTVAPGATLPSDRPSSTVLADFTGDGHVDLAISQSGAFGGTSEVAVQINDGAGGMGNGETFRTDGNTYDMAPGDFDGDGDLDLMVLGTQFPFVLASFHKNDGTGKFGFSSNTFLVLQHSVHEANAIVAGDFDENGDLDIAVAGGLGLGQWVDISLGDGAGGFSFLSASSPTSAMDLQVGDLNNDGHLDLLSPHDLWLGAGDGSFQVSSWSGTGNDFQLVDVDSDGDLDVLGGAGGTILRVHRNDGSAGFAASVTSIPMPWLIRDARALDMDLDGVKDLVVVGGNSNPPLHEFAILRGTGAQAFAAPELWYGGSDPRLVEAADWDQDGVPDLAIVDRQGGGTPSLRVMMGTFVSPVGSLFCDGSGTAGVCPCSNNGAAGHGCAHSESASGAFLCATGTPSSSADSLQLLATATPANKVGVFFQGTQTVAGGFGALFGDGLRCAGGQITRLETVVADAAGVASSSASLGVQGGVLGGDLLRYQYWFRDPQGSPCGSGFNLTNGLEVLWLP